MRGAGARVLGVTGTFCSGKTTVALFLKRLGARVIDADRIVGELYAKDKKIRKAILKKFGPGVFIKDKISRRKLGRLAFASKKNLLAIAGIVHPKTINKIKEAAGKAGKPVVAIDAPLLIESGLVRETDAVLLVKCSSSEMLRRASARGFTRKEFIARKAAQMPFKQKAKFADFIIDNSKSRENTRKEVSEVWKRLKKEW